MPGPIGNNGKDGLPGPAGERGMQVRIWSNERFRADMIPNRKFSFYEKIVSS